MKISIDYDDDDDDQTKQLPPKVSSTSTLSDVLQSVSKYYFENGAVDIYKMHPVYHNVSKFINPAGEIEVVGFLKSEMDFMENHCDDWSLILNNLRSKYNARKRLWEKYNSNKDKTENGNLFYVNIIYDIKGKFYQKLTDYFEKSSDDKFLDYARGVKKIKNILLLFRV